MKLTIILCLVLIIPILSINVLKKTRNFQTEECGSVTDANPLDKVLCDSC